MGVCWETLELREGAERTGTGAPVASKKGVYSLG